MSLAINQLQIDGINRELVNNQGVIAKLSWSDAGSVIVGRSDQLGAMLVSLIRVNGLERWSVHFYDSLTPEQLSAGDHDVIFGAETRFQYWNHLTRFLVESTRDGMSLADTVSFTESYDTDGYRTC